MKIATLNINNVNKRLPNLLAWLRAARPDVVCLQELKASDAEFPADALRGAGYEAVWRGQKTWNGVAILARGAQPIVTRTELPGDPGDRQSRYIEAAVNGVLIASLYAPNGNPQPGVKFEYKLAWLERLAAHAAELYAAGVPVVLAGDFNVVPTDRDIYPTRSWANDALVQPESRAALRRLLDQGWVDAVRTMHPEAPMYTFWDYMRNRWQRDAGLRIDLLLLSADVAARLVDAGVDRDIRGEQNASDHAPAWVVLRDNPGAQRIAAPASGAAAKRPPSTRRAAAFAAGALTGCFFLAPAAAAPPWDAVKGLFEADALGEDARRVLLSGRSADGLVSSGPIVCACFSVGLAAIRGAVASGAATNLESIGAALRAGTNCGSCLPELKRIVVEVRVP
jgi:exodeoxyribonuclease III